MAPRPLRLVTGFWDPAALDRAGFRNRQAYLRLFEELHVSAEDVDMTIFTGPETLEDVKTVTSRRRARGEREILVHAFADLPYADRLDELRTFGRAGNETTGKDTTPFKIMTWAKTELVAEVARGSPSGTILGWVDFGIAHVAKLGGVSWSAVAKKAPAAPRVCEMRAVAAHEIKDTRGYYQYLRGKVASGFFTVGRGKAAEVAAHFRKELERALAVGCCPLEEQVFGALLGQRPDAYERWRSDYVGILTNYDVIREDASCVLENLSFCRKNTRLSETGLAIYDDLAAALTQRTIRLPPREILQMLHDAYICAYYADRERAVDLADLITALYSYGSGVRTEVERLRPLLDTNLAFTGRELGAALLSWKTFSERDDFRAWCSCL